MVMQVKNFPGLFWKNVNERKIMMTRLYITRHGQTQWNLERRFQGHKDSPLTDLGVKQAQWLSESLKDVKFDAIYSSPIYRAYHTADIIRGIRNLEIRKQELLKEMSFGEWEGLCIDGLNEKYRDETEKFWNAPHLYQTVSGETFEDVQKRVIPALHEIINNHKDQTVLMVAHGIVLKLIFAYIDNISLENLWESPVAHPTSLSIIDVAENEFVIIKKYDVSHYKA